MEALVFSLSRFGLLYLSSLMPSLSVAPFLVSYLCISFSISCVLFSVEDPGLQRTSSTPNHKANKAPLSPRTIGACLCLIGKGTDSVSDTGNGPRATIDDRHLSRVHKREVSGPFHDNPHARPHPATYISPSVLFGTSLTCTVWISKSCFVACITNFPVLSSLCCSGLCIIGGYACYCESWAVPCREEIREGRHYRLQR